MTTFIGLVFIIGSEYLGWRYFGKIGVIIATVVWVVVALLGASNKGTTEEPKFETTNTTYAGPKLFVGMQFHRFDGDDAVNCKIVSVLDEHTAIVEDPYGNRVRVSQRKYGPNTYSKNLFTDTGQTYWLGGISH